MRDARTSDANDERKKRLLDHAPLMVSRHLKIIIKNYKNKKHKLTKSNKQPGVFTNIFVFVLFCVVFLLMFIIVYNKVIRQFPKYTVLQVCHGHN